MGTAVLHEDSTNYDVTLKILITADIHANYVALLAVLRTEPADEVWCLGDLVAFGPQPAETIEWVRECARYCVRGNHDEALVFGTPTGAGLLGELGYVTRQEHRARLTPEQMNYLRRLPLTQDVTAGECRFHLAHAIPGGDFEGRLIMPDISDEDLQKSIGQIEADVICCGHTHFPMFRRLGQKIFLNPGSVGLPLDGDQRASYAVWHDGKISIRRAKYDLSATATRMAKAGLPPLLCARLSEILTKGMG
jgi:putative phosphoesterase